MKVYVLTRTDNFGEPRRIIEGVFKTKESAERERQNMLLRYNAPSKLCWDTAISEMILED